MILFDTETTGLVLPAAVPLNRQPRIIEFTAVRLDDKTLKERCCISFLLDPGMPLPPEITKITGITSEMVKGQTPFGARFEEIADFFDGERILIAHNLKFDTQLLGFELERIGKQFQFPWPRRHICTVEASFSIGNRRMKLGELYELATGQPLTGAHRSETDTRVGLASVVRWLIQKKKLIKPLT